MSRSVVLVAFAHVAVLVAFPVTAIAQWNPPLPITANSREETVYRGSTALDGNDRIHFVYTDRASGGSLNRILYLEGMPSSWGSPIVLVPAAEQYVPDLAVHPNGTTHIVYQKGIGNSAEIRYLTNATGAWVDEAITTNAVPDHSPAVAVDGDDRPHVAWAGFDTQSGKGKIFYARREAGTWTVQRIAASYLGDYWIGAMPRISVSVGGIAQIAYRAGNYLSYRVDHANKVSGSWQIQTLPTENAEDFACSIRTDPYGVVRIATSGADGFGLPARTHFRASFDRGVTWTPATRVSGSYSAAGPVLVVDWFGISHIAWEETAGNFYTGTIFHATDASGSWFNEAITGPDENFQPSPTVDGSGFVHVLYQNQVYSGGNYTTEVYYLSNATPTVNVSLAPQGPTAVPRGGSLPIDVTVSNGTPIPRTFDVWWTGIHADTGAEIPVPSQLLGIPNPVHGTLGAGKSATRTVVARIPASAPTGIFTLTLTAGNHAAGSFLDRASLVVKVLP